MNGIQYLMDLPFKLPSSIFAYSLIYPYSDNLLDDSATTTTEKRRFNHRFRNRLDGHLVEPQSNCEDKIYRLVDMIEDEYDRLYTIIKTFARKWHSLQPFLKLFDSIKVPFSNKTMIFSLFICIFYHKFIVTFSLKSEQHDPVQENFIRLCPQ